MSRRQHIWTDTDPDRSGLLPFVFSPDAGFEDYAAWALDVPMYFLKRGDQLVAMNGTPFRTFLEKGAEGHRATLADWNLHLTTLFPEVRLKTYIEVRSADSQPPERLLALPALIKGVLYDADCRLGAWDLVKDWTWERRVEVYHASHRDALAARAGRFQLLDLARELVRIARTGLERQRLLNDHGQNEAIYLDVIDEEIVGGRSPARVAADGWGAGSGRDVERLIEACVYRLDSL